MCPADLLLLDEPTNHLDLDALVWLEAWLQRYAGTLIVDQPRPRVPRRRHQRHAAPRRDEADALHRQLHRASSEMRASACAAAGELREAAGERAHLQKFIDRFKAKASKAKQAQSRVKVLARMEEIAPVLTSADFQFEFREPLSAAAIRCSRFDRRRLRLSRAEGAATKPIVRDVDRSVLRRPAHRHPRRQRPGQVDAGEDDRRRAAAARRQRHRRQGPRDRLLRAAGARRALARRRAARSHMVRLARDVGPARARAGAARLPRRVPLHRRDGDAADRHASPAARRRGSCSR